MTYDEREKGSEGAGSRGDGGNRKWEQALSQGSLGKGDFTKLEAQGAKVLVMQNGSMS